MSEEAALFLKALVALMKEKDQDYNAQDAKFVKGMIPHHEMAVEMAEKQIAKGENDQIIGIARAIKTAQRAEIAKLKKWLADRDIAGGGGGMSGM